VLDGVVDATDPAFSAIVRTMCGTKVKIEEKNEGDKTK
jgi:hypothetical protein